MRKHLFIINPAAGLQDASTDLIAKINALDSGLDVEYQLTKAPGHAGEIVKEALARHPGELSVYACGGDGTLFEVVNGGAGSPRFAVTSVPVGTGNDFIKSFPEYTPEDFRDIRKLVNGSFLPIDSMRVGDYTSVNIVSAGFDAITCKNMAKYKSKPIIGGKNAYNAALVECLLFYRKHYLRVVADGEELSDGKNPLLFALAANGRYYGGGYKASPISSLDDGLMDVITIPTLSILKFARFAGVYRRGEHIHNPKADFVNHSVRREMQLFAPDPIPMNVDGEIIEMRDPKITLEPKSITVILPQK